MNIHRRALLALALATGLTAPSLALAEDTIKIGLLATFEGPFTVLGEDGQRGAQVAVDEFNGMAAGKKVEIVKGSSDASPDSAVRAARKLVEQDGVKILVGPLSGDEGIAVKDYAKTHPEVTFINGTSAAQDTTLRDPAPNFFRFSTDGAQWMAGLGTYAFNEKGYKKVATVAEDYSFPYTQVFGFMAEFCKAGGTVPSKSWVPIGNKDYSSVIAAIPDDVDAIYVALGGADGVNFLTQYQQAGGEAPLIGGSITVDQTVLTSKGKIRDVVIGTPSAGPIADTNDTPAWKAFVEAYKLQSGRLPVAVAVRAWLLHQHEGGAAGASTRSAATSPTTAPSCATRCRNCPSTRRPARCRSTRTATRSPTSSSPKCRKAPTATSTTSSSRWCRRSTRRWASPRTSS